MPARLVCLALFAMAQPAFAWDPLKSCGGDEQTWDTSTMDVAIGTASFSSAGLQDAAIAAIEEWNGADVGEAQIEVVSHLDGVTQAFDPHDDINSLAFSGHPVVTAPGVRGWADIRGETCAFSVHEIVEMDIHLNQNVFWSGGGDYYDFCDEPWGLGESLLADTVRHEVGHGLGLGHVGYGTTSAPGTHLATMFQTYQGAGITGDRSFVGERRYNVSEDDRVGLRALYPRPQIMGDRTDVAAQSYFYDEDALGAGECTAPSRPSPVNNDLTQMAIDAGLPAGDCPLDPFTVDCLVETVPPLAVQVYPGDPWFLTFTLLNLGEDSVRPNARILFTEENDPNPTTYTVLDTWSPQIDPGLPYEVEREVLIPDVEPGIGVYYFVLQLDYDDLIGDRDPSNNEAIYNQQVVVQGGCTGCHQAPLRPATWALAGLLGVVIRRRRQGGHR